MGEASIMKAPTRCASFGTLFPPTLLLESNKQGVRQNLTEQGRLPRATASWHAAEKPARCRGSAMQTACLNGIFRPLSHNKSFCLPGSETYTDLAHILPCVVPEVLA